MTKFKIIETAIDAVYNITVNGYYNDNDIQVGEIVAFQFNLETTPHASKAEFLASIKLEIENSQPIISEEELEKMALAETAKDLLDTYIDTNITLNPPIE